MALKKKPALRFKGFTDDWEQRKVSDIAGRYDNLRVPVSSNKRVHGTTPYYGANGVQDYVDGYTHDGEYILIAEDGANDLQNYPVHYVNGRIWVNNHAHVLQGKTGIADTKFLSYAFSQIDISSLLVGGGRAKLNAGVLMKLDLLLPEHKEQEKLGNYFSHIDSLITLHQRKYEMLKKIKKSFLEKMFPKNGKRVPELRFSGFTDDWEQRKLGDECSEIVAGGDINKKNLLKDGRYPVIANALTDDGIVGYYANEYRIKAPAVTVTGRGDIGHAQARKTNFTPVVRLLSVISKHNVDFLAEAINQNEVVLESTGVPQLTVPTLANYLLRFPSTIEEEKKIGQCFSQIDHLITLHQRKLEKLQNLKKAVLKKMFI